jgi:hypothetical protein
MELCDGIDNDCDNRVDEDFPDELCCTENIHCPAGATCNDMDRCEGQTTNPTNPPSDPENPLPADGAGTCTSPIRLQASGFYTLARLDAGSNASIVSCTGNQSADELLAISTPLGKEAVFAFNLPQARRVRVSSPFNFFDHVLYTGVNACPGWLATPAACAESTPLDGALQAELEFDALANTTYYIVLDTTLNALGEENNFTLLFETL